MQAALRIGLLVDTLLKQQHLTTMIIQTGHQLCYRGLISAAIDELPELNRDVDAWIVDIAEDTDAATELASGAPDPAFASASASENTVYAALDYLLEHVSVPVILSDSSNEIPGSEAHQAWLKRMAHRLRRLSGDINLQQANRAPFLWVLAASTGGPAAVKEFLNHLPGELNLAFVYVQHIDANYAATLLRMMGSAGRYSITLAHDGAVLQQNSITLFTADQRIDILENGTLSATEEPWAGCYAPSIDQIVANAARTYRGDSGLIVFTGMGDDGAASSRLIKQQGGQVWVQTPSCCTSPSMPEAALATGCVNFSGTPAQLAQQLTQHMSQHILHARVTLP